MTPHIVMVHRGYCQVCWEVVSVGCVRISVVVFDWMEHLNVLHDGSFVDLESRLVTSPAICGGADVIFTYARQDSISVVLCESECC